MREQGLCWSLEGGVHAAGPHLAAGTSRATFYVRLAFVFMCARMCMSMLMDMDILQRYHVHVLVHVNAIC